MSAPWLKFEQAVAALLQALDPSAVVTHNAILPDADTGEPRQRDVWIEMRFGGHFALKILVSCKRVARRLHAQDLDTFIGELASSGAQKGVLYSLSGFTKPALKKAAVKGISCCVLLENQPPPIPDVLAFEAYVLREKPQLRMEGLPEGVSVDLAALLNSDDLAIATGPAYRVLAAQYDAGLTVVQAGLTDPVPPIRQASAVIRDGEGRDITLIAESTWLVFVARIEAWLVNGSYSFTDNDFKGSVSTLAIDTWSEHPGPGWREISVSEMAGGSSMKLVFMASSIGPRLEELAAGED